MAFAEYQSTVLEKFDFLIAEYHFVLTEVRSEGYGCFLAYEKADRKISLGYEWRESRFFYYLMDKKTTIMFKDFFLRYDPSINWYEELMPKDNDFEPAIDRNIALLKKYGVPFLEGKDSL